MFAGAVEGELVRGYLEPVMGEFHGFNFILPLDQDIVNAAALFTDEMLMPFDQRIETLQPPQSQHLELLVDDEFL